MDTGWIHHYSKLLSGRGYVLNWELQKASQLAKRNKKYITKATQSLAMIIPPHFQREVHKQEWACTKLEGYALPLANDYCHVFAAPRKDCWMKESRTGFLSPLHLWHIKYGSMPKPWLSKQFSDNHWVAQSAATATIINYSFIFQWATVPTLYLLWTASQVRRAQIAFQESRKGVLLRGHKCRGSFQE